MKETNMEHYRGEIEEILESSDDLPCLIDGELQMCKGDMDCCKCEFRSNADCRLSFIKWLMSEYKPEPVLTQREKGFLECVVSGWIARNKNGVLWWSKSMPQRQDKKEFWLIDFECPNAVLNNNCFPFITWEDEEPWAVEELRKLKAENE